MCINYTCCSEMSCAFSDIKSMWLGAWCGESWCWKDLVAGVEFVFKWGLRILEDVADSGTLGWRCWFWMLFLFLFIYDLHFLFDWVVYGTILIGLTRLDDDKWQPVNLSLSRLLPTIREGQPMTSKCVSSFLPCEYKYSFKTKLSSLFIYFLLDFWHHELCQVMCILNIYPLLHSTNSWY